MKTLELTSVINNMQKITLNLLFSKNTVIKNNLNPSAMKKCVLITAILLVALATNAQVNDIPIIGNKFTFGVDAGLSLPSSDYGTANAGISNTENALTGSAKSGFYYDLYGGFKFSKLFGVMVQYGGNSNSFNTSNLGSSSSASGGYTVAEYLVGPYLSITLVKIKIEAKLLGGMVTSNYPTLSFSSYGTSVVDAFQNGSGFGYCAGAKVKYMLLGGALGIGVGLNYVSSDVKYSGWTETVNGKETSNGPVKMNIGLVQPTVGLSLDI